MTKPWRILITATIICATSWLYGQNLLQDTDFQPNACGEFGRWMLRNMANVVKVPKGGSDGREALLMNYPGPAVISILHDGLKLVPGAKYRVGGYVRTKGFHAEESGIQLRDAGQIFWSHGTEKFPEDTNGEWVRLEATVTAEDNKAYKAPGGNVWTDLHSFVIFAYGATGCLEISAPFLEAADEAAREGTIVNPPILQGWGRIMPFSPVLSKIPADKATLELGVYCRLEKPFSEYECQVELAGQSRRFPLDGKQMVTATLERLEPGHHEIKFQLLQKEDGRVLQENAYPCTVVAPQDYAVPETWLNNLVSELARRPLVDGEIAFTVPRDGWYWFGLERSDEGTECLLDQMASPVIRHRPGERSETMRFLPAGEHHLTTRGAQSGNVLTIRSVKELMCFPMFVAEGDNIFTNLRRQGKFFIPDLPFFRRHIWPAINTQMLAAEYLTPEAVPPILGQECRDRGIRLLNCGGARWGDPDDISRNVRTRWCIQYTDGRAIDEISTWWPTDKQVSTAEGLWRLCDFEKLIYLWNGPPRAFLFQPLVHRPLLAAVANAGQGRGKLLLETYITTSSNQQETEEYMNILNEHVRRAEAIQPGAKSLLGFVFSGYATAGSYNANCHPQTDFKWTLDYYFWKLANDPELMGIYCVGYYSYFYGDEELTRWAGALLRHYCVDGQREMLSSKYGFSCNPELLSNCDFDEGLECWTPAPAQPGAISPWYRKNFGRQFQRRSNEGENCGDHAALFVRSDKGPNRLTQKAIGLIPGHKYALRFYTADPDEIELDKGVSVNFAFRADVSDARILPELGYERRYMARHEMVTHKVVFIPEGTEADITFSDWKGDDEVGAPVGQRRVLNFVSLTPFFE